MQITKQLRGETVELKVEGRVDGYWADHLAAAVDQEIRQGSHHIQLDLSRVAFLSSAGIGTLVRLYKDLKSIQGSFAVSNYSRNVLKVIQLSKLEDVLVAKAMPESLPPNEATESPKVEAPAPRAIRQIESCGAIYEVYPLAPGSKLECRRLGNASLLERCGFAKEHCRTLQFSDSTFAIGLGALGEHFEDCQGRFGEFIAAGGAGRSPVVAASEPNAFQFPRIRDWLSFTAERAYTKSVVLLAGIAVRGSAGALAPVIRPFPNASSSELAVAGHFHAAAFSYRPVQRGQIDLKASIKTLFEGQALEGILHLLSDDRALSGSGQSELVRGACWIAPISDITAEGAEA